MVLILQRICQHYHIDLRDLTAKFLSELCHDVQVDSTLIPCKCSANQWTGSYTITASVMKELTAEWVEHYNMWRNIEVR